MDAGVDVSHREVRQVVAVAAVDRKNPDLMGLAGLQLVEEFAAPLLPSFLECLGSEAATDNHMPLHSQVLLHQVPHCPWVIELPVPHASLRICSLGRLDRGDGSGSPDLSLTSLGCGVRSWLLSRSFFGK